MSETISALDFWIAVYIMISCSSLGIRDLINGFF
jgi:hypothetical protein